MEHWTFCLNDILLKWTFCLNDEKVEIRHQDKVLNLNADMQKKVKGHFRTEGPFLKTSGKDVFNNSIFKILVR